MKKVITLVTIAALSVSMLAGCGNNSSNNANSENTSNNTSSDSSTDSEESGEKTLRIAAGKTETLNPLMINSGDIGDVMYYMSGSLLQIVVNEDGSGYEFIPYHAKEMPTMSEDGLTWTFELRDDLKWSDGTPITAETYEYTFKALLDPQIKNYMAFKVINNVPIKNAGKYYNGETTNWEDVGVKALEGNKLEITLEKPVSDVDFKLVCITGQGISPVHPEMYEASFNADRTENSYGTSVETTPSSGAYVLTNWVREQEKQFEKNENDPLANLFTPDKIYIRVVQDKTTAVQLFSANEIDYVSLDTESYKKFEEDPRLVYSENASISNLLINMESEVNPILKDINFRNALFYGMNRDQIAEQVFRPAKAAPYFISEFNFVDDGLAYRDSDEAKALLPENNGYDKDKAVELFNKAYESNGNQKVELSLTYDDQSESTKKMAELLEAEYENLFGSDKLDIQLQAMPNKALIDNVRSGKYDLAFGGWGGGVFDPWAWMIVYTSHMDSWNPNKLEQFKNDEYDELYDRMTSGDLIFDIPGKIQSLARMEELLYEAMPFVPIYEKQNPVLFADRVTLKTNGNYYPLVGFGVLQSEIEPLQK